MLEMKALVSNILRKFHLSPVPGKENLDLRYRVTLRVSGGIWVSFSPRKDIVKQNGARDL